MQLAGQGLVKLNSDKIKFLILYIHCKPYHFLYETGFWGLGGSRGLRKTKVFFQGGCSQSLMVVLDMVVERQY